MTIDTAALRRLATAALDPAAPENDPTWYVVKRPRLWAFQDSLDPTTVLALLDRLDAAEARVARLEGALGWVIANPGSSYIHSHVTAALADAGEGA